VGGVIGKVVIPTTTKVSPYHLRVNLIRKFDLKIYFFYSD